jgi:hypothetical protein
MKIETNNYSQPSFNATLKLKGNTKLLAENQDLILEVFAKRFGSYEDIIEFNLPKKFVKNKATFSVTTSVNNITDKFTAVVDKNMFLSSILNTKDKLEEIFTRNAEKPAPTKVKTEAEIEAEKRAEEEAKIKAEKKEKITTDKLNEILDFSKNIENLSQEQSIILVKSVENLLNNPIIKDKIVRKVYNSIMSDKELLGGIIERVYSGIIGDDYKMQSITGRVGYLGAFESNPITYHARHTRR